MGVGCDIGEWLIFRAHKWLMKKVLSKDSFYYANIVPAARLSLFKAWNRAFQEEGRAAQKSQHIGASFSQKTIALGSSGFGKPLIGQGLTVPFSCAQKRAHILICLFIPCARLCMAGAAKGLERGVFYLFREEPGTHSGRTPDWRGYAQLPVWCGNVFSGFKIACLESIGSASFSSSCVGPWGAQPYSINPCTRISACTL